MEKEIKNKIRDTRQGFADAQAGTAREIREKNEAGCFKNAHRTFEQGIQCVQLNSVNALQSIQNSVMIIHAPYGCAACGSLAKRSIEIQNVHAGRNDDINSHVVSTALGEKEVILGGEARLKQTAEQCLERYDPKIIFIISSCASAIIGDDIDSVAEQLSKEYPDKIFAPVHCEGFKSRNHATGYDLALSALQNYVIKDHCPEKKKGLINLFATHSLSLADKQEMKRLLSEIGLNANILPYCATYEDILNIPAAEYNISVCQIFGDEYMEFLYQKYGTPYTVSCMPVGSSGTDKWLRAIAKLTGREKEAEELIIREREKVQEEVESIHKKTDGLTACITAGTGRGLAAASILADYGIKMLCIHTPYYEKSYVEAFEQLEEFHGSEYIINVADMQPFEQINLIKKLKPDLFIGMANWASRLGIPTTHILDGKRPTFGYRGVLYLGRKLEDALDNNNFNAKMAKYTQLPFREEWYDEDPFKYIVFPAEG